MSRNRALLAGNRPARMASRGQGLGRRGRTWAAAARGRARRRGAAPGGPPGMR